MLRLVDSSENFEGPKFDLLKALQKKWYNFRMGALDTSTVIFWHISRVWSGQEPAITPEGTLTVEAALKHLNSLLDTVGPHHPLRSKIWKLRDDIVHNSFSSVSEQVL